LKLEINIRLKKEDKSRRPSCGGLKLEKRGKTKWSLKSCRPSCGGLKLEEICRLAK
jgi:hypothetical protein